jgi:hypothetical protein
LSKRRPVMEKLGLAARLKEMAREPER